MVTLKPAWLLERELPSQLLKVGSLLIALPSSPKDLIELLDKVGGILSQGVLISDVLTNQADPDAQISLAPCFSELLPITTPNPPSEGEHMKKIIVSSHQALPDTTNKSFHKRLHILECMDRVKSYVMLLALEYDALVMDIFHQLLASPKDDHFAMTLAYVESILVGILMVVDDLLFEYLISILYQSHQVSSQRVLDACASQIPLQQIISFIDEIT
ncbi:LOW QUALITY PROTEIN: hypothetical protein Cgig2_000783 [Carnegiea gigantea]|uniref:Uncharacterized protein n=1 Tax=Carnegiea gigantea TaxID=171969 RepID=A0A9Q1QLJ6_9CARY|nr:LOW QUALITY PROTEIN: hypothetical protein Cgig2_000783 [Carnegiea gigantea]